MLRLIKRDKMEKYFHCRMGTKVVDKFKWQPWRIAQVIEEFCANSSIHGLQYWFDRERHWTERVWWMVAFVLSFFTCVALIYSMWLQGNEHPVLMSFNHERLPISTVPIPAMTICPLAKSRADTFNYTSVYRPLAKMDGNSTLPPNATELRYMRAACQMCDEWFNSEIRTLFPEDFADNSILSSIAEMATPFNDTIIVCHNTHNDTYVGCSNLLIPIYTDAGLCYTYNSLSVNDIFTDEVAPELKASSSFQKSFNWALDHGYDHYDPNDPDDYPYRYFDSFDNFGVSVYLKTLDRDIDYLCNGEFDGYSITLHLPNEMPSIRKNKFYLSAQKSGKFWVAPNLIATAPELRGYEPHKRQCFFNREHKLRFYRHYTRNNCELECLTNFTYNQCGCVHFAMPRSNDMKICGVQKLSCMTQAESDLLVTGSADACDCLPHCNTLNYDTSFHQIQQNFPRSFFLEIAPHTDSRNSTFSLVHIEFINDYVEVLKRIEFRSFHNFLASAGGLFGLFIGASFLSLFEFIYFFVIRICHQRDCTEVVTPPNAINIFVATQKAKQASDDTLSRNSTNNTHL